MDLAGHVRAWGWWVLQKAKADLARFYPIVDDKPTVAYFWARTVTCKNCRATLPLLKTRWLAKKDNKRVLLTMEPNADRTGVVFGVQADVPTVGGNAAQKQEFDKRIGGGTMSRSGATCPCCGIVMTTEDIRLEGQVGRLGMVNTCVVVEAQVGKEYRLPSEAEINAAALAEEELDAYSRVCRSVYPPRLSPIGASRVGGGSPFTVPQYGITRWSDLFIGRQLAALGTFVKYARMAIPEMQVQEYPPTWVEAISLGLCCLISKLADKNSTLVEWQPHRFCIGHTFKRFALPIYWDFVEVNVLSHSTGNAWDTIVWIADIFANQKATPSWPSPTVLLGDAQAEHFAAYDAIVDRSALL